MRGVKIQSIIPDGNHASSSLPAPLLPLLAKVRARDGSVRSQGTAFAIGDRFWVTAAHVLNSPKKGFAADKVWISPSFKEDSFFTSDFFEAEGILHSGWNAGEPIEFDFALLFSPEAPQPAQPFSLSVGQHDHVNKNVNVIGYPEDENARFHIMPIKTLSAGVIKYQNDTLPGQSGGPVILWPHNAIASRMNVIGVHCEGPTEIPTEHSLNRAMALRHEILVWIDGEKAKK